MLRPYNTLSSIDQFIVVHVCRYIFYVHRSKKTEIGFSKELHDFFIDRDIV